mmetsp:Transcript_58422/g.107850  ORF Transcript_58422/g.107850 Transcript_58422/m.107850 type:complete len:432 (-) Transcript_58422:50-1345(-)
MSRPRGKGTQDLKERFKRLDLNRDGKLDFNELSGILRRGHANLQDYEIKAIFDQVDKNGDGKVEFGEFVHYMTSGGEKKEEKKDEGGASGSSSPQLSREGSKGNLNQMSQTQTKKWAQTGGPGPGDYDVDKAMLSESSHHRCPTAVIGSGPGHGLRGSHSTPGPGAYRMAETAKDHLAASGRGFVATFGSSRGHSIPQDGESSSPGPAFYDVKPQLQRGFVASFGKAIEQKGDRHFRHTLPGPGEYASTSSFMSVRNRKVPNVTMGRGPGHVLDVLTTASPGPGAYHKQSKRKVKGGAYFGTGHAFGYNGTVSVDHEQARRSKEVFRMSDKNCDGILDLSELQALLKEGHPSMKDYQVKVLFDHVDKNNDGVVALDEFIEFINSNGGDPFISAMRRTLKKGMSGTTPGPLDYSWQPSRSTIGGSMGRATGH